MYIKIHFSRYLELPIVPSPFLHTRRMRNRDKVFPVDVIDDDGYVFSGHYDDIHHVIKLDGIPTYRKFLL